MTLFQIPQFVAIVSVCVGEDAEGWPVMLTGALSAEPVFWEEARQQVDDYLQTWIERGDDRRASGHSQYTSKSRLTTEAYQRDDFQQRIWIGHAVRHAEDFNSHSPVIEEHVVEIWTMYEYQRFLGSAE